MFNCNRLFILSIGNHLDSCRNDVKLLYKCFQLHTEKLYFCGVVDCDPYSILINFIKDKDFESSDLLIIHYSGHGKNIGIKIDKMYMMSTWISDQNKHTISYNIDKLLSDLKCKIFLISDSCHSGTFGDWYTGKSAFIFLGSSNIVSLSTEYNLSIKSTQSNLSKTIKNGILLLFLENLLLNHKLNNITKEIFSKELEIFYITHKIKIKYILKFKNIDMVDT